MDIKTISNLKENIGELNNTEKEASIVELELFQRTANRVTKKKVGLFKQFLFDETEYYKQNLNKYSHEIKKDVEEYAEMLQRIVSSYETIFVNAFEVRQKARNNQKICVSNITLLEKNKEEAGTEKERTKILKKQMKFAQKKINYTVLINECTSRILWCITHMEEDILAIYNGDSVSLVNLTSKSKFITKLKIFFQGKSLFKQFLHELHHETLPRMKLETVQKENQVSVILAGFLEQVKDINKQIKES